MLINAFIFRRKNFEMHYLNRIIMISMRSIFNMKNSFELIRRKY